MSNPIGYKLKANTKTAILDFMVDWEDVVDNQMLSEDLGLSEGNIRRATRELVEAGVLEKV